MRYVLLLVALVGCVPKSPSNYPMGSRSPEYFAVQDPRLTPGDTISTDTSLFCHPGYTATVRGDEGRIFAPEVYASYGAKKDAECCRVDHLIPLELGGISNTKNFWPEPTRESFTKDSVENYYHRLVCDGKVSALAAQELFRTDWRKGLTVTRSRTLPH